MTNYIIIITQGCIIYKYKRYNFIEIDHLYKYKCVYEREKEKF